MIDNKVFFLVRNGQYLQRKGCTMTRQEFFEQLEEDYLYGFELLILLQIFPKDINLEQHGVKILEALAETRALNKEQSYDRIEAIEKQANNEDWIDYPFRDFVSGIATYLGKPLPHERFDRLKVIMYTILITNKQSSQGS